MTHEEMTLDNLLLVLRSAVREHERGGGQKALDYIHEIHEDILERFGDDGEK